MKRKHKVGNKVVALSTKDRPSQPRKVGEIYIVTYVYHCPSTGDQLINIDNILKRSENTITLCSCGRMHNIGNNLSLTIAEEFVDIENIQEELDNAVETENFEVAATLHKIQSCKI